MSTNRNFAYPVELKVYSEPSRPLGVVEMSICGKRLDWWTLDTWNPDLTLEEAKGTDLEHLLEWDSEGLHTGDFASGKEHDLFEYLLEDLYEGGNATDTLLYANATLAEHFGEKHLYALEGEHPERKPYKDGAILTYLFEPGEPLELNGEYLTPVEL